MKKNEAKHNPPRAGKIEIAVLIVILIFAAFLIFKNLGQQLLWTDEAETAVIAKNILKYGYPSPWDGENLVTQQSGKDIVEINGRYFWAWHPWVSHYLTAGSFAIFKVNTLAARLPFAVMGLATIFVLYLFARRFFKSAPLALLSAFLLTVCVPFLLYARQCRYYMPVALFGLLVIYFYNKKIEEGRGLWGLIIFSILLFYTNFLSAIALFTAIFLFFIFADFKLQRLKWALPYLLIIIASAWPWFYYFYTGLPASISPVIVGSNIYFFLIQFSFVFPLVLVPFLIFIWKERGPGFKLNRENSLIFFIIIISWFLMSYFRGEPNTFVSMRYLTYLYPLFILLLAQIIIWFWSKLKFLAIFLVMIIVFTNLLTLGSFVILNKGLSATNSNLQKMYFRSYLAEYWYEINHQYAGPMRGIIEFLLNNSKKNETLLTNFDAESIIFYTQLKVINRITDSNNPFFKLTYDSNPPDWILPRIKWPPVPQVPQGYNQYTILYPDLPWENLPEMDWHYFKNVYDWPLVKIYQKADVTD